jgi:hypothetical protein
MLSDMISKQPEAGMYSAFRFGYVATMWAEGLRIRLPDVV